MKDTFWMVAKVVLLYWDNYFYWGKQIRMWVFSVLYVYQKRALKSFPLYAHKKFDCKDFYWFYISFFTQIILNSIEVTWESENLRGELLKSFKKRWRFFFFCLDIISGFEDILRNSLQTFHLRYFIWFWIPTSSPAHLFAIRGRRIYFE